jgi:hypothetical protein
MEGSQFEPWLEHWLSLLGVLLLIVTETMKSYVVTSPGNMADTLKHHIVRGKVPFEHE